eukprot:jgi/Mesen1/2678/ME000167S01828
MEVQEILNDQLTTLWQIYEASQASQQHLDSCLAFSDCVKLFHIFLECLLDRAKQGSLEHHEGTLSLLVSCRRYLRQALQFLKGCRKARCIAMANSHIEPLVGLEKVAQNMVTSISGFPAVVTDLPNETWASLTAVQSHLQVLKLGKPKSNTNLSTTLLQCLQEQEQLLGQQRGITARIQRTVLWSGEESSQASHAILAEQLKVLAAQEEAQSFLIATCRMLIECSCWLEKKMANQLLKEIKSSAAELLEHKSVLNTWEKRFESGEHSPDEIISNSKPAARSDCALVPLKTSIEEVHAVRNSLERSSQMLVYYTSCFYKDLETDIRNILTAWKQTLQENLGLEALSLDFYDSNSALSIVHNFDAATRQCHTSVLLLECLALLLETAPLSLTAGAFKGRVIKDQLLNCQQLWRKQDPLLQSLRDIFESKSTPISEALAGSVLDSLHGFQQSLKKHREAVKKVLPLLQVCVEGEAGGAQQHGPLTDVPVNNMPDNFSGCAGKLQVLTTKGAEKRLRSFLIALQFGTQHDKEAAADIFLRDVDRFGATASQHVHLQASHSAWCQTLCSSLLDDTSVVQEASASAVRVLTTSESNSLAFVKANVIKVLITVLDEGLPGAKKRAAQAYAQLASHGCMGDAAQASRAVELVTPLLHYQDEAAVEAAALALKNVVFVDPPRDDAFLVQVRSSMVRAQAVPALLKRLSASCSREARAHIVGALAGVVQSSREQVPIRTGDMMRHIVVHLSSPVPEARFYAVAALASFNRSLEEVELLVKYRGLPGLVAALKTGEERLQSRAATALLSIVSLSSRDVGAPITAAGGIAPLVGLVSSKSSSRKLQLLAVDTLSVLAKDKYAREAMLRLGAVPALVSLARSQAARLPACAVILAAFRELVRHKEAVEALVTGAVPAALVHIVDVNANREATCLSAARLLCELVREDASVLAQIAAAEGRRVFSVLKEKGRADLVQIAEALLLRL